MTPDDGERLIRPNSDRATERGRHTPWYRHLRWAVVLLALAWLAAAGFTATRAALDLRSGRRAGHAAAHADLADVAAGRPLGNLRGAQRHFARAHRALHGALLAPVRVLPVVGRQLRSADALSGAASTAARIGVDAVQQGQSILALPHRAGSDRVRLLRSLADLANRTDARLATLNFGPRRHLTWPFVHAHAQLVDDVAGVRIGLRKAAAGARAGADLLVGPRTYLVFAANNSEMRAGSGMFLSVGQLTTRDGTLQLSGMTTITTVPQPQGVPLEPDLAARWGWLQPGTEWRNLMLTPRFDVSAALASQMWSAVGRPHVDGVIALDPVTLSSILDATGPVVVNDRTVKSDDVVDELLHDQYLRFPNDAQNAERRSELSAIATAAVGGLEGGNWSPGRLASGLSKAARGRHLMVWSSASTEEQAWQAAGATGTLQPDSMLLSVVSRGGNKLDQYLRAQARLELHKVVGGTDAVLTVTLKNTAPPGEPVIIDGPYPDIGTNEGDYLGILTVNLPGLARDGRIDGVDQLAVAGSDGPTRVVGVQLTLPRGKERTLVVRFRLPAEERSLRVEPSARVPAVSWSAQGVRWTDGKAHTVSW